MTMVVVIANKAILYTQLRVLAGLPFALLYDHSGIGNLRIATGVVIVQMRVNNDIDVLRTEVHFAQLRGDFVTRLKMNRCPAGHLAQARSIVGLHCNMHAGIKQDIALGMLDQV